MTPTPIHRIASAIVATLATFVIVGGAAANPRGHGASPPIVTARHVAFVLSTLAHDSMEGRGTATRGSMRAARFIADQFRLAGLTPAGDSGYFQHVPLMTRMLDRNSTITVDGVVLRVATDFSATASRGTTPRPIDGAQVIFGGVPGDTVNRLTADQVRGKLVIVLPSSAGGAGGRGGTRGGGGGSGGAGGRGRGGGGNQNSFLVDAAAIATIEGDQLAPRTQWAAQHPSTAFVRDTGSNVAPPTPAAATLSITTHAAEVLLGVPLAAATKGTTGKIVHGNVGFIERPALGGNVVGIIEGTDPALKDEVVLVDAHYDHLGIGFPAVGSTDTIYNGADDDASGTTAVIEIARAIKAGPAPKRTLVLIATTGEEVGLLGTNWYIAHPVRPLSQMVANLEIEMIDRPDSLVGGPGKAWLTGYERSTMGDMLAAAGLPIVKDPRPDQSFFQRSDNIAFARMGIPAHTLSTFDLHRDYHQANDEFGLANIDHMVGVISAAITAVRLLADGPKPEWHPGGKP